MRILSFFFLLFFSISSCVSPTSASKSLDAQVEPLTIFLVRHAEKQSAARDPELTKEGVKRSVLLAEILENVELDAVFSTDYKRTQSTVQPTASEHQLDVISYSAGDLEALSGRLKADYQGKTVLVVGHSNTTPALTSLLEGNATYQEFDESDYGNLVMVTIPAQGMAKAVFLRY